MRLRTVLAAAAILAAAVGVAIYVSPVLGAGGLLHPTRNLTVRPAPDGCAETTFAGAGIRLRGWKCAGKPPRRGAVVYLHGIADNRASAAGVVQRFTARGFDAIAYDSRAHGQSEGEACTYGFFEKEDLHRVIDVLDSGPIVLIGTSLGAAVALQEAAGDDRVAAVVAAETFSDLRTIAAERAPAFFTAGIIRRAFDLAAEQGRFDPDAVSPRVAAARITRPVLLIHGEADVETHPDHSRRVFDALRDRSGCCSCPAPVTTVRCAPRCGTRSRSGLTLRCEVRPREGAALRRRGVAGFLFGKPPG